MTTVFLLLAQYDGRVVIPIETICADFFAPLTLPNLRRKIAAGEFALPLTPIIAVINERDMQDFSTK
jgi:hypothetical protein